MDNKTPSDRKMCVTCGCWMGARTIAHMGRTVESATNAKGDCMCGGIKRSQLMYNYSCAKWNKWGTLR